MTTTALTPAEILHRARFALELLERHEKRAKARKPVAMDVEAGQRAVAGRPSSERYDCVVRAFTVMTGLSYARVHALFAKHGRKCGKGTKRTVTNAVAAEIGAVWVPVSCHAATFLRRPRARPVAAFISGHAFAVGEGVVLDIEAVRPKQRVKGYFHLPPEARARLG